MLFIHCRSLPSEEYKYQASRGRCKFAILLREGHGFACAFLQYKICALLTKGTHAHMSCCVMIRSPGATSPRSNQRTMSTCSRFVGRSFRYPVNASITPFKQKNAGGHEAADPEEPSTAGKPGSPVADGKREQDSDGCVLKVGRVVGQEQGWPGHECVPSSISMLASPRPTSVQRTSGVSLRLSATTTQSAPIKNHSFPI